MVNSRIVQDEINASEAIKTAKINEQFDVVDVDPSLRDHIESSQEIKHQQYNSYREDMKRAKSYEQARGQYQDWINTYDPSDRGKIIAAQRQGASAWQKKYEAAAD